MDGLVKLGARLSSGSGARAGYESFWGSRTGEPGQFVVRNLLAFCPFTLGDVVSAVHAGDAPPQVVSVVSRSPRVSLAVRLQATAPESGPEVEEARLGLVMSGFVRAVCGSSVKVEVLTSGIACVQLADGDGLNADGTLDWPACERVLAGFEAILPAGYSMHGEIVSGPFMPVGCPDGLLTDVSPMPEAADFDARDCLTSDFVAYLRLFDRPSWIPIGDLRREIVHSFKYDARVRRAVASGNFHGVAVLAVRRIARVHGVPVPRLEGPLL